MKQKINKENWSGEEGSYEVKGNTVIIDDCKYSMYGFDDGKTKHIQVRSHQHNDQKIWDIYSFEEGHYQSSGNCGIEREGKTPAEVVAKLHWNLA